MTAHFEIPSKEELLTWSTADLAFLAWQIEWKATRREKQVPPDGDWTVWGLICGRGFGKTRVAAEWTGEQAWKYPRTRWLVAARTTDDLRAVCFEGEALCLETPIATPDGWARFGDLKVGDRVFSGDGSVTQIVAVSPVWHDRPCYAVSTGTDTIIADANHKWLTQTAHDRKGGGRFKIRTTEKIARGSDRIWHRTPDSGAIDLPPIDLPIPPYTLGAWLGDGDTRGHGTFTCHIKDVETIERIRADGYSVVERSGSHAWGIRGLRVHLRQANLNGHKHIPDLYQRASFLQRLELLRGLMDTDGYVSDVGQCAFDNTDFDLVSDTRKLLITLGFKAGSIQTKPDKRGHKMMYRVTFRVSPSNPIPFNLTRKAKRCQPSERQSGRVLKSVERVESVPVRCIQVAHPSGLFLAGKDMIVTHNSGLMHVIPKELIESYNKSLFEITLKNGSIIRGISAEKPAKFRGPQFHGAWFDELAAWDYAQASWDMAMFGIRLKAPGLDHPKILVSSTPQNKPLIKQIVDGTLAFPRVVTFGSSYENLGNLAGTFRDQLLQYEGTQLGRQEIYGELIEDENGVIQKSWINLWPHGMALPVFEEIILSLDTAMSEHDREKKTQKTDPSAGTVWGVFKRPMKPGAPEKWGIMLLDSWSEHLGLPDLIAKVKAEMLMRYGGEEQKAIFGDRRNMRPHDVGRMPDTLLIEDKSSGISLRQMLAREGILAKPYNPGKADKLARLHNVSHIFAGGFVWARESKKNPGQVVSHDQPTITQLCSFHGEGTIEHDDLMDSAVQAIRLFADRYRISVTIVKKDEPEDEDAAQTRMNPYGS